MTQPTDQKIIDKASAMNIDINMTGQDLMLLGQAMSQLKIVDAYRPFSIVQEATQKLVAQAKAEMAKDSLEPEPTPASEEMLEETQE